MATIALPTKDRRLEPYCTGEPIMLPDLRYWSVELQEAYANAEISFERFRALRAGNRK